jgi:hypothetical protein
MCGFMVAEMLPILMVLGMTRHMRTCLCFNGRNKVALAALGRVCAVLNKGFRPAESVTGLPLFSIHNV